MAWPMMSRSELAMCQNLLRHISQSKQDSVYKYINSFQFSVQFSVQQYYKTHKSMASIVDFFNNLKDFSYTGYCATGANQYAAVMLLHLGTLIFVLNVTTKDYSWVDRIWSILPIGFAIHLLYYQVHCDGVAISGRQYIMFAFILSWGLRLTYNFYRKGGYTSSGEDYRWEYIRKNYPRLLVELLNFFFTSYYQLYLIYWFTTPIYYSSSQQFTLYDILLCLLWIVLFIGQVTADQQQWNFQTRKYQLVKQKNVKVTNLPAPYNKGFITTGLFRYSRHPNFFCEFSMWWVIYFLSVSSQGWNLSGIGALLLNLLFLGSTALTELISCQKYPAYIEYKKQVPMLVPGLPKKQKSKQG